MTRQAADSESIAGAGEPYGTPSRRDNRVVPGERDVIPPPHDSARVEAPGRPTCTARLVVRRTVAATRLVVRRTVPAARVVRRGLCLR
ncbi:hypothetical protein ACQHIV_16845 [Kribbella sp. GL6]|uniref:hypothetical protein n=1 Tax=Kribbella sp. GL6 TaxID=3419765 RepID=UPI003CFC5E12